MADTFEETVKKLNQQLVVVQFLNHLVGYMSEINLLSMTKEDIALQANEFCKIIQQQ